MDLGQLAAAPRPRWVRSGPPDVDGPVNYRSHADHVRRRPRRPSTQPHVASRPRRQPRRLLNSVAVRARASIFELRASISLILNDFLRSTLKRWVFRHFGWISKKKRRGEGKARAAATQQGEAGWLAAAGWREAARLLQDWFAKDSHGTFMKRSSIT